jgi:Protein of unknown function (DUF2865)
MRRVPSGIGIIVSLHRDLWRLAASFFQSFGKPCLGVLAIGYAGLVAAPGASLAQVSDQQVRCMQLQQELAAAQGGGGANSDELRQIQQQIADADRVFQGTQAAMEDAGCYDSFFIFGRGLVRSPKCLKMNDRVEDARRDLTQLKEQRKILKGGGGNRRRQAELQDALARSGCGGAPRPRRGGLFDFFGGGREEEPDYYQRPVYRSINPGGRYRSVCVRLCDGFYYPIHYSIYGSQLGPDAQACQTSCAAPAELYVYQNPGQDIEQAVSLSGSAYMDLPVALRYRKEYVKGCSCKQSEYNPTEIEGANKKAEADTKAAPPAQGQAAAPAPQAPAAPEAAAGDQPVPQFSPEVTGSTAPAEPGTPAAAAVPSDQGVPALPEAAAPAPPPSEAAAVDETPPAEAPANVPAQQSPPPPPVEAAAPAEPPPAAEAAAPPPAESAVVKRPKRPAAPQASPFGPQF